MPTDLERFVAADGRTEAVERVRAEIDAKGITYIYYQFASVTGRIMGKGVPADHWERMAERGFQLVYGSTANLFIDRHGNYIGYGPEASELVGLPDVETFCQLPWDPKTARVFCTLFRNREEETDPGGYLTSDCRGNLRRIHQEFEQETGLHLRVGTEPEMMWLKVKPDGTPSVDGKTKPYCYHIDQFAELQPLIHKVMEYGKAMGLDMIQGDHEDAPGQLELNWMFDRADLTADRLTTYRQICRQVGRELGAFPCFMPKPFMGVSANGCHHNISLWQGDENMFLPDGDNPRIPSKLGLMAIGGVLDHLNALTCITADICVGINEGVVYTTFDGAVTDWHQNAFLSQPEIGKALRRRAHLDTGAMFGLVNSYTERLLHLQKQYAEWSGLALLKSTVEQLEARLTAIREAKRGCILPLGWGAGFLSKIAFLDTQDETYRQILRQVGLYSRAIQSGLPFPKTRRIVFLGNQPASIPGFVHLEVTG